MFRTRTRTGLLVASLASILTAVNLLASVETRPSPAIPTAPCEPALSTPRPQAPTGLHIIRGESDLSGPYEEDPFFELATASGRAETVGGHAYFDALSARADCMVAFHLRSDAQLDVLETQKSGLSEKGEMRFPVTYDSVVDAAVWRINPSIASTDGEGKRLPMAASAGSILFTWELRFDAGHTYLGSGYLGRHKTYMIGWHAPTSGDNRYIGFKTVYIAAAKAGQGVAEFHPYMIGDKFLASGTSLGSESRIEPSTGRFFIAANTWTRVWVFLQDIGQPVSYLSVWAADPSRGPVQLQNRNAVFTPVGGITKFWFEYDTSGEDAINGEMRSWNRNFVALRNVPPGEVAGLLQRPTP